MFILLMAAVGRHEGCDPHLWTIPQEVALPLSRWALGAHHVLATRV